MRQVTRSEYLIRHLRHVAPYVTLAKLANLALNVIELRLIATRPRSLPPYIKVEPTSLCQLACPGCAHGKSDLKKQLNNKVHFGLDDFRRIVDPLANTLFGISLSLRGEPMLGKDFLPMIEYGHARNIAVSFPTNLSLHLREGQIERLVQSGADTIFVSLDGASVETYNQYRVGGDFDLVLRNVRSISDMKKRLGRTRPRLVWKFVVFDHNRHEIAVVQSTFAERGFDAYEFVQNYDSKGVLQARGRHKSDLARKKKGCFWAWHTTIVRSDGQVAPCCKRNNPFQIGNTRSEGILEIWRGSAYAKLRDGFRTMREEDLHPVCAECLGVVTTARNEAATAARNADAQGGGADSRTRDKE